MNDCLFCKIVNGDIKPDLVLENEYVLAFRDINPQAPEHVLIIPKKHIASLNDLNEMDAPVLGRMYLAARQVAEICGVAASGYRTLINCGMDGGQTVLHLHLHMLGGRSMHWPPG